MAQSITDEKARGAFFTPPEVSRFITEWAIRGKSDKVLEPSCGEASFLLEAAQYLKKLGSKRSSISEQLFGVEIHEDSAQAAAAALNKIGFSAQISAKNFFDCEPEPKFDAVIGNPPYIRYQQFSGSARNKGLQAALAQGVRLTGLASSWAAFTIHAAQFLNDDGRLGLVLPAELLSVNYAAQVRRFLLERFKHVRLVLFEKLIFPGVLEEVVLLLAEGRGTAKNFEVVQVRDVEALNKQEYVAKPSIAPKGGEKWTSALIPIAGFELYKAQLDAQRFAPLASWGTTYLGAVTGNNQFFCLSAQEADEWGLSENELLRISPPGGRHLKGLTLTSRAWNDLAKQGDKVFLFAPDLVRQSKSARRYIDHGEHLGVPAAYKCKVRSPWWRVPLVERPDLLFTYMNHASPRFTANEAGLQILNSIYGTKLENPYRKLGVEFLPLATFNSVTQLGAEIVGRAYGGGLLKHEPKEADLIPLPSPELLERSASSLRALKPQTSVALRGGDVGKVVDLVDQVLLHDGLGISNAELKELKLARELLMNRRQARAKS